MDFRRVLITGGAGFVGSCIAVRLAQSYPGVSIVALDNLLRRGSELNLRRLKEHSVSFYHGDVRCPEDLDAVPPFDLLIECSAEPSVHAGQEGSPVSVVHINLIGALNCLEVARKSEAAFLFLSTSRVYPIEPLNGLRYSEGDTRYVLDAEQDVRGCSHKGITEDFPVEGARSFYGATKLSGEALIQEYVFSYGMRALINRCGVIAGPGQMGKVDQGVVTLWVARHMFQRPLSYTGFEGKGKQVRDILHVDDLCSLLDRQLNDPRAWDGRFYNVGGGLDRSASLRELTGLCREITGKSLSISSVPETTPVDVRIYLTDATKVGGDFAWKPERSVPEVVSEVAEWLRDHEAELRPILGQ
jgi:CDP-paratose 2-epimerase